MTEGKFAVSRFVNRNGTVSWRVAGWLGGIRIRKNFATREEAAAEKQVLELKAAGVRTAPTFLSNDQLRQAEAAVQRLHDRPHSLLFYLDYGIANFRERGPEKPLADAITEYVAAKRRRRVFPEVLQHTM